MPRKHPRPAARKRLAAKRAALQAATRPSRPAVCDPFVPPFWGGVSAMMVAAAAQARRRRR